MFILCVMEQKQRSSRMPKMFSAVTLAIMVESEDLMRLAIAYFYTVSKPIQVLPQA